MRAWGRTALVGAVVTTSFMVAGAEAQAPVKPAANYWVSADTVSGMMAGMASAPGGRPGLGAMMGAMTGRGPRASHTLRLQLGSTGSATAPSAEHLPPAGLRAGATLPLLSPRPSAGAREPEKPFVPEQYQQPKGRMLIFWGCGERARSGQPVVVDFAKLKAGQIPPGFASATLNTQQPPSPSNSRTYGEWPNERTRTSVPFEGSLVGDHMVRGNYTPDIRFSLATNQDFLAPLELTSQAKTPAGAVRLAWGAVPNAQAYAAFAMGAGANETMVVWSSSESQLMPFALNDYLSDGDIQRLIGQKVLMPSSQTQCAVPQEAVTAMQAGMLTLVAHGREASFAYPPRPSNPQAARTWKPEWTTKVRYKSTHLGMLGMDMGGMMRGSGEERGPAAQPQAPAQPPANETPIQRARRLMRERSGLPIP